MSITFKKDPDAILDYTFDWGDFLTPSDDTIFSVSWVVDDGLTVGTHATTATTATAFVSGGTVGQLLKLTCRITTTGGRIDDRTILLKIVNR